MIKISKQASNRFFERQSRPVRLSRETGSARVKTCRHCGHEKWAVSYNPDSGLLHCFSCGKNESLLDYVVATTAANSRRAAVVLLRGYGNVLVESPDGVLEALRGSYNELFQSDNRYVGLDLRTYCFDFTAVPELLKYARRRRVPEWFIQSGRLGYFAGMEFMGGMFSGRLCFLTVADGEPVFVQGRAVYGEIPKYISSTPEKTGGLPPGKCVFNLDLILPGDDVIICEGVLSALCCNHGVAVFGKRVTDEQAAEIKRARPGRVYLLREQGVKCSEHTDSLRVLYNARLDIYSAELINGDPNDDPSQMPFVLAGAKQFQPEDILRAKLREVKF